MAPVPSIRALAGGFAPGAPGIDVAAAEGAVVMVLGDLKQLKGKPLHSASAKKSIDWAVDQFDCKPENKAKFVGYRKAFELLITPEKGKGKEGKGKAAGKKISPGVVQEFERICMELGAKFDECRLGDLANLLTVLKANVEGLES